MQKESCEAAILRMVLNSYDKINYYPQMKRKMGTQSLCARDMQKKMRAKMGDECRMGYKLAVFDMDGTILDTLGDLANATNYALRTNALRERSIDEVRRFVGNGIEKLIRRAVEEGTPEEVIQKVYRDFMPYYKEHCADLTKPYDGIVETMRKLKGMGILLAVVSNKADPAVQILCGQYFDGIFDVSVGEKPGVAKKPAPDMVNEVLEKLGIDRRDAVYIGDSDVDVATAKNSGLDEIIVKWGFRDEEYLKEHGAKRFVDRPDEIVKFFIP